MTLTIMSIITQLPQIGTDLTRMSIETDANCQKWMGVITSLFSMIMTMGALGEYEDACFRGFENLGAGAMEWRDGPGYILMYLATAFKFIDVICHILVPTPPHCFDEKAMEARKAEEAEKQEEEGAANAANNADDNEPAAGQT